MSPVAARSLDFSNVKESSGINPKHLEDGEYLAKVVRVEEVTAKDDTPMWLFVITPDDHKSAAYPYYCKLQENQLWKVRNLFISAGLGKLVAGKSKVKINPEKVVGRSIGIVLEEDEYEGKTKSVIEAVMPASDLEDGGVDEDPDIDVEEDEEEEEATPAPKAKKRKPAPVVEDDEDEEEEEEEAPAPKKRSKKAAPVVEEEDEEEEEEEEAPAPKKRGRKAKAAPVVEEDDEEEEEETPVSKRTAARRAAKKAASKKAAPAEDDEEEDDLDLDDL